MLTREENELITRTGPGTPMGELFRRFWLPVMLPEELTGPDCVPVRLRILGEDLIAFKDTSGRVGLLDAYCAHRGAPLFFGRNSQNGLRCVYHFTGISSFPMQDVAVIEDQRGRLMDRSRETLTSSDAMIVQVRRKLMKAARDLREGREPALPHRPDQFQVPNKQFRVSKGDSLEEAIRTELASLTPVAV